MGPKEDAKFPSIVEEEIIRLRARAAEVRKMQADAAPETWRLDKLRTIEGLEHAAKILETYKA